MISQVLCDCEKLMDLPARAFTPPPKVDSAVVKLVPKAVRPEATVIRQLEKVTAAAFGQRRKMLRSSLKPLGGEALLERAGIEPTERAEQVAPGGLVAGGLFDRATGFGACGPKPSSLLFRHRPLEADGGKGRRRLWGH